MAPFSARVRWVVIALSVVVSTGCGGSGGNDAPPTVNTVTFSGTLKATSDVGALLPLSAATICALGSCNVTTEAGTWSFSVPQAVYDGGTVAFAITAPEVVADVSVSGLSAAAHTISVDFVASNSTSVQATNVTQDSTPLPTPTPTPDDDEDDDPLSTDPQERACQILERTNITITNIAEPIVHESGEECPEEIRTIAVVGNIHPIGFEYSITSDAPDAIEISPATGTVAQGQLNKHAGAYLCTRTVNFVANITARVVRYFPPDGVAITADEAIALCGRGANVGNTEETKQIPVLLQ